MNNLSRIRFKFPEQEPEKTPKGKRRAQKNIYGNWVGYVSGRRWKEFGCQPWSEREAMEWVAEEGKPEGLFNDWIDVRWAQLKAIGIRSEAALQRAQSEWEAKKGEVQ